MSRIRKKIEKRAARLLIESGIFNVADWDEINLCFYSTDYWGESNEINPCDYLYDLAIDSSFEYVCVDWDTGYYQELGKKCDLSIIEAIRLFKANFGVKR